MLHMLNMFHYLHINYSSLYYKDFYHNMHNMVLSKDNILLHRLNKCKYQPLNMLNTLQLNNSEDIILQHSKYNLLYMQYILFYHEFYNWSFQQILNKLFLMCWNFYLQHIHYKLCFQIHSLYILQLSYNLHNMFLQWSLIKSHSYIEYRLQLSCIKYS